MNWEKNVAFVTGAGGYIGGVTAMRLARKGMAVAVCDLDANGVQRTVSQIESEGGRALGLVMDVTNSNSVDAAIEKTVDQMGGLDLMVHAAGGSAREEARHLVDQSDEVLHKILGVNLFGALYSSRAAARAMIQQGRGGRIINISSIVALNGLKGCVDYAAAKGGIIGMTRSLAKELGAYGITVNSVAPGVVLRPGVNDEHVGETNFLGMKCTADDVANVILFLASDEARFVTGQIWNVDGARGLAMKGTD